MSDERVLEWLRLGRVGGVGPVLVKRLVEAFGSAGEVLRAGPAALSAVEGIGTVRAQMMMKDRGVIEKWAAEELGRARAAGVVIVTQEDEEYPAGLRGIPDSPLVLYVRGKFEKRDAVAVGIVGPRQCTLYGREQAGRFGFEFAQAGLTVISGGARGIDTASHEGALRAGGRTIVVQGCGLSNTYPPENVKLYERIVENGGAVISELPLDAPPTKENFPPRNRIIAGMSLGVLVVEANMRSGSLITARLAAADYGREVFALPGRVDSSASAGTHHLIKAGMAHLVESAEDILEGLGEVGAALKVEAKGANDHPADEFVDAQGTELNTHALTRGGEEKGLFQAVTMEDKFTSVQQKVLSALAEDGSLVDELIEVTGLAASVVMGELNILQISGFFPRRGGNRFGRKSS